MGGAVFERPGSLRRQVMGDPRWLRRGGRVPKGEHAQRQPRNGGAMKLPRLPTTPNFGLRIRLGPELGRVVAHGSLRNLAGAQVQAAPNVRLP